MAKEKLTFDDAKAIIVKNLPEDFFSGPNGEKHKEALSLMREEKKRLPGASSSQPLR